MLSIPCLISYIRHKIDYGLPEKSVFKYANATRLAYFQSSISSDQASDAQRLGVRRVASGAGDSQ